MNYILILGAKSELAKELAILYAKEGFGVILAGRNIDSLADFSESLKSKYNTTAHLSEFDLCEFEKHKEFYQNLRVKPYGIIVATGNYLLQGKIHPNNKDILNCINTNITGPVSLLSFFIEDMKRLKKGFIVGISSVSGERGRKKNYIYGCSKAAFTTYLSGIRNELYNYNVHVLSVICGYIQSDLRRDGYGKYLEAHPSEIARIVFNGQRNNRNIIYVKWYWKILMLIIKIIPEFVFKRLNI